MQYNSTLRWLGVEQGKEYNVTLDTVMAKIVNGDSEDGMTPSFTSSHSKRTKIVNFNSIFW